MKLLIVDDDVYTREGLAENIPWELYGIEEVMQAENGKEAFAHRVMVSAGSDYYRHSDAAEKWH